jgi:alpha-D-ribose 1-methylphosphonate 5-triphosphate synthase subunit PhnH
VTREARYDEVFDAQKHFRSLLDSTARPGKINRLDPVELDPPPGLNRAGALVAFALMDSESTFHAVNLGHGGNGETEYLAANTHAQPSGIAHAHFLFAHASESPDFLEDADCGTLLYPDTGATLILELQGASAAPLREAMKLTLEGPGIDGRTVLYVRGLNPDLLLAIQARNAEFPLGIDTIFAFTDETGAPAIAALPRTTRVTWEQS